MSGNQPIIVVKKKGGHGGHHGGAWKVAYADFVTAMMALFIVLWLMNSSKQVQEAVGGYFKDPTGTSKMVGTDMQGAGESFALSREDMPKLKEELQKAIRHIDNFDKLKDQIEMTVTAEGLRIRPLAHMLAEAVDAPTPGARNRSLQRLGDVSLFIAGFFARSFARKLVDIDYHIAMGGNAYSSLADTMQRSSSGRTVAMIYAELAQKFQRLVDALNEVSEMSYQHTDADILRLYEVWLKTGSARAHGLLNKLGVQPVKQGGCRREH